MLPRWTSPLGCSQLLQSVLFEQNWKKIQPTQKHTNSCIYNTFLNILCRKKYLLMVGKQWKESLRRWSPPNIPGNLLLVAFGRQLYIYCRITSYISFGSKTFTVLKKKYFQFCLTLSSLKAIFNLKYDHTILVQILELYNYGYDQWREEDCLYLGPRQCGH